MKQHRKYPAGKRGFSLVEMLIVLTVLGILFAIDAPNLFTLMQASTLSSEGSLVRNKLSQAQQLALSKNTDIEVRFFKMADASNAETEQHFRGFQFYQFNDRGRLVPVSKFFRIKPPVVISEQFSTLLNPGSNSDSSGQEYGFVSPSRGKDDIPLGDRKVVTDYVSFRFRPDGSTDLPGRTGGDDTWYLTLLQGTNTGSGLPPNYFIVQVDSYNGRVGVYRP